MPRKKESKVNKAFRLIGGLDPGELRDLIDLYCEWSGSAKPDRPIAAPDPTTQARRPVVVGEEVLRDVVLWDRPRQRIYDLAIILGDVIRCTLEHAEKLVNDARPWRPVVIATSCPISIASSLKAELEAKGATVQLRIPL